MPVSFTAVPSGPLAGAPVMLTVGGRPVTDTVNEVVAVAPRPSLAVMVIVCTGASSEAGCDQVHVPLLVPVLFKVPAEADSVTASPSVSE